MFITSSFDPFFNNFNLGFHPFLSDSSIMGVENQKNAFIYVLLLLSFHFFRNQNQLMGRAVLLSIPIFSISFLPGIWGGILLLEFCKICFKKFRINKKDILYSFIVFGYLLLFFTFYKLFGEENKSGLTSVGYNSLLTRLPNDLNNGFNFSAFKVYISNFIYYSIPAIFHYVSNMLKSLWIGFLFFIPLTH